MESGNLKINRNLRNYETLEERHKKIKITIYHQARLKLVDISLEHLKIKNRLTKQGNDGPTYCRKFSPVNGHFYSFFPSTIALWNQLPAQVKGCERTLIYLKKN